VGKFVQASNVIAALPALAAMSVVQAAGSAEWWPASDDGGRWWCGEMKYQSVAIISER
jgi:hypothetical protein